MSQNLSAPAIFVVVVCGGVCVIVVIGVTVIVVVITVVVTVLVMVLCCCYEPCPHQSRDTTMRGSTTMLLLAERD